MNESWDQTSYHFLSQVVIFLDVNDSKQFVEAVYAAYRKHPATDTFTLQFMAFITINYLNCCYHQHADKSYAESTFKFLQESSDHVLVVSHDDNLSRVFGVDEAIEKNNFKKLTNYRNQSGESIHSLEEVFQR